MSIIYDDYQIVMKTFSHNSFFNLRGTYLGFRISQQLLPKECSGQNI